jgi:NitT/TauT family transport system substrate-binding protein
MLAGNRDFVRKNPIATKRALRAILKAADICATIRFYSLRLREAGMIKSSPSRIASNGTNWQFFNEVKRELKS